jgi:hypothetical protein
MATRYALVLVLLAAALAPRQAGAQPASCPCPAHYCVDPPAAARAKEALKANMAQLGVPARLRALVDRLPDCVGCVASSSVYPNVVIEYRNGAVRTLGWSRTLERNLRLDLAERKIKSFHLILNAKACACCEEQTAEERPDWDSRLSINRDLAIPYTSPADLGDEPADLTQLEPEQQEQQVEDPGVAPITPMRVVQTLCRPCEPIAEERNGYARQVDELNRRINKSVRMIIFYQRLIGELVGQMAAVGGLAPTRKTDQLRQELMERYGHAVAQLQEALDERDRLIGERDALMEKITDAMNRLLECEQQCQEPPEEPGQDQTVTADSEAAGPPAAGDTGAGMESTLAGARGMSVVHYFTPAYGGRVTLGYERLSDGEIAQSFTRVGLAMLIPLVWLEPVLLDLVLGVDGFRVSYSYGEDGASDTYLAFGGGLRGEWFVTSWLSLHTEVGLVLALLNPLEGVSSFTSPFGGGGGSGTGDPGDGTSTILGSGDLVGNAGFTFWF